MLCGGFRSDIEASNDDFLAQVMDCGIEEPLAGTARVYLDKAMYALDQGLCLPLWTDPLRQDWDARCLDELNIRGGNQIAAHKISNTLQLNDVQLSGTR
jgi:hypothetical protein